MPEYVWMYLHEQDSEYASSPKYARILNMTKFYICEVSVTRRSEYATICLHKSLNISWVLNMPGFWIWQGSDYERDTLCFKYAAIWLNISV